MLFFCDFNCLSKRFVGVLTLNTWKRNLIWNSFFRRYNQVKVKRMGPNSVWLVWNYGVRQKYRLEQYKNIELQWLQDINRNKTGRTKLSHSEYVEENQQCWHLYYRVLPARTVIEYDFSTLIYPSCSNLFWKLLEI